MNENSIFVLDSYNRFSPGSFLFGAFSFSKFCCLLFPLTPLSITISKIRPCFFAFSFNALSFLSTSLYGFSLSLGGVITYGSIYCSFYT